MANRSTCGIGIPSGKLVERGLRGRLKMQSLLTGQLYVDLDFYPDKPARFIASDSEVSEIPTIPTAAEELVSKLEGFPMDTFLTDLAAISQSLNTILSSEAARMIPVRLEATLAHLQSLSAKLDRDGGPMLTEMRADLVEMRKALEAVRAAMVKVGGVAEAGSPVVASLGKASEELAKTAQALQGLAGEESPTVQHLNTALQEISRAAHALRLLAETLEQQPEAVLQGKRLRRGREMKNIPGKWKGSLLILIGLRSAVGGLRPHGPGQLLPAFSPGGRPSCPGHRRSGQDGARHRPGAVAGISGPAPDRYQDDRPTGCNWPTATAGPSRLAKTSPGCWEKTSRPCWVPTASCSTPGQPPGLTDYQLLVEVLHFENESDGAARLVALWSVRGKDGGIVLPERRSSLLVPALSRDQEGQVRL